MTVQKSDHLKLGTAGWSISAPYREHFPATGSQLERYASRLNCVEINSSFYRPHRRQTYERWAHSTPEYFKFAVKVPKKISHAIGFNFSSGDLDAFCNEVTGLAAKLAVFLLQMPPSLAFDIDGAGRIFSAFQTRSSVPIACEPRHASWFTPKVDAWLAERKIARVAADPARAEGAGEPGGWRGFSYFRFHGSPKIYYSNYDDAALDLIKTRLDRLPAPQSTWCIFDNTAAGAALGNVLAIMGQ